MGGRRPRTLFEYSESINSHDSPSSNPCSIYDNVGQGVGLSIAVDGEGMVLASGWGRGTFNGGYYLEL